MSRPAGSGRKIGCKTKWGDCSPHMHDGYRVHENPDGSCVFVEGIKVARIRGPNFWGQKEESALNACCARRGIVLAR